MYVCMYVYMYMYICMYIYMYVYICTCNGVAIWPYLHPSISTALMRPRFPQCL